MNKPATHSFLMAATGTLLLLAGQVYATDELPAGQAAPTVEEQSEPQVLPAPHVAEDVTYPQPAASQQAETTAHEEPAAEVEVPANDHPGQSAVPAVADDAAEDVAQRVPETGEIVQGQAAVESVLEPETSGTVQVDSGLVAGLA
ncbi:MAG TPA: hypothetical protein VFY27_03430, partial [Woeseiaceae bacterium]|nr:hypothetical protein [Woeseiaceae bacterium]